MKSRKYLPIFAILLFLSILYFLVLPVLSMDINRDYAYKPTIIESPTGSVDSNRDISADEASVLTEKTAGVPQYNGISYAILLLFAIAFFAVFLSMRKSHRK